MAIFIQYTVRCIPSIILVDISWLSKTNIRIPARDGQGIAGWWETVYRLYRHVWWSCWLLVYCNCYPAAKVFGLLFIACFVYGTSLICIVERTMVRAYHRLEGNGIQIYGDLRLLYYCTTVTFDKFAISLLLMYSTTFLCIGTVWSSLTCCLYTATVTLNITRTSLFMLIFR